MHARIHQGLPDDADCLVVAQLLQLLGLPREEAAEIARRPLPQLAEEPTPARETDAGAQALGTARMTS
jgi:hypothetical protein